MTRSGNEPSADSAVSACIQGRRTLKVLGDPQRPWPIRNADYASVLADLLGLAACAPFHYPCHEMHRTDGAKSPAPWRCCALDTQACRALLEFVLTLDQPLGKIGSMLACADGLLLVTWLPDPADSEDDRVDSEFGSFAPSRRNMEHIAAAAAAIQNLLLAAHDREIENYWSSGGAVLRSAAVFEHLSIPPREVLLGAVFLFPKDTADADTKPGANRRTCGDLERWVRWIGDASR